MLKTSSSLIIFNCIINSIWFLFYFVQFECNILFDLNFWDSINWYVFLFENNFLIAYNKTQLTFIHPETSPEISGVKEVN